MNLGVFLTILLEHELSFEPLVLILSPPPVLSSLSLVLRHCSALCLLSQDHRKSPKPLPPLIVGAGLNCGLGVASNNLHSVYFSKLTVLAEFDLKVQKVSLIYIELGLALMITSLSMKVHTLSQKR